MLPRHIVVPRPRSVVKEPPLPGLEPGTFGLEFQRAIHCATGATHNFVARLLESFGFCQISNKFLNS